MPLFLFCRPRRVGRVRDLLSKLRLATSRPHGGQGPLRPRLAVRPSAAAPAAPADPVDPALKPSPSR
eukprot:CAMPEP_0180711600 /NCGR_PEP_ID=MMETSP1038_2-20121128/10937_1 /TAXON_ID=632150 /ORGANISM="Azadinium spinosum, Strain 3D9" /LENGTH=66 /DNA_ID=CAMNT_0022743833 /DNA_START=143 /DNA_END=340 /DNA_ORIENTATION=+